MTLTDVNTDTSHLIDAYLGAATTGGFPAGVRRLKGEWDLHEQHYRLQTGVLGQPCEAYEMDCPPKHNKSGGQIVLHDRHIRG